MLICLCKTFVKAVVGFRINSNYYIRKAITEFCSWLVVDTRGFCDVN